METKVRYISFVGDLLCPKDTETLENKHPYRDTWGNAGYRRRLSYEKMAVAFDGALDIWVAKVSGNIGHVVADCRPGDWIEDCFCLIGEDLLPIKASDFNPNPVEQAF